ncbi:MAG TPA: sialidase family protein [Terriglobales bacterium]|nr:sialidase family protein [Terriglobales bacterium]
MRFTKSILIMVFLTIPGLAQTIRVEPAGNPAGPGSLEAHWSTAADGAPLLSWIDTLKDGSSALRYSIRRGSKWSEPRTIIANRHFFRQPAESPSVVSFPDGSLLAEWVEIPEGASEAEYIYVSASKDGAKWTPPIMAHRDRTPVQHALVSMAVSGEREASLVWLEALKGEDEPSVLIRTVVSSDGKIVKEETLDSDVCTCCPTSIVKTSRGLLVAYRDHTPKNIRDIATVRYENGKWLSSKILHPDKWEINACPVNGAFASAKGDRVAIAWYTEGDDMPRVQLLFSTDGGATFGKLVKVSIGNALGHASVALNENGSAYVSWIEEGDKSSRLFIRSVSGNEVAGPVTKVADGSLGYPRLLHTRNETWIAWGDAKTGVKTAQLK